MADCGGIYSDIRISFIYKRLEERSVDFVWSHAVLEHVSASAEFLEIHAEKTRRVISDDGVCSHTVDLKDHLDQLLE